MAINISNSTKSLTSEQINDMQTRVEKYKAQGGVINPERAIYIDYTTQEEYVTYSTYQNIISRWELAGKPSTVQIYIEPVDISNDDKILPTKTFLDMETRVNSFKAQGGVITDTRRIYLDMNEKCEYITYLKYKEVLNRVEAFRKANN